MIALAGQAAIAVNLPVNPNTDALFDRDAMLRAWAIETLDANRDGWLTPYEA